MDLLDLHRAAMGLVDQALAAGRAGDRGRERELYVEALRLEQTAAGEVAGRPDLEPTRAVLHRSAASLALRCGEWRLAERLACAGLAESPPEEVAQELREVIDQAAWRCSPIRGQVTLSDDTLEISLAGAGIGPGVAPVGIIIRAIETADRLIQRVAERLLGMPFRQRGRPRFAVPGQFAVCAGLTEPGSYVVPLKVGGGQPSLFHDEVSPGRVVADLIDRVRALHDGDVERVRSAMPDDRYLRNFVGLSRNLLPDGTQTRKVGLRAATSTAGEIAALLTRTRSQVASVSPMAGDGASSDGATVTVRGRLQYANATGVTAHTIKIVDDHNVSTTATVPEELMDDIVRPLWNQSVEALLRRGRGSSYHLEQIDLAAEDG